MKLYEVTYKTWNIHFSDLDSQRMLAVGNSPEDAIRRAKKHAEKDVSLNACIELTLLSLPKQLSKIKGQFPQKCCRIMCNYFCDCPIFEVPDVPDHDNNK